MLNCNGDTSEATLDNKKFFSLDLNSLRWFNSRISSGKELYIDAPMISRSLDLIDVLLWFIFSSRVRTDLIIWKLISASSFSSIDFFTCVQIDIKINPITGSTFGTYLEYNKYVDVVK